MPDPAKYVICLRNDWRHREIQEQLFGAKLHAKLDNHRRETMLQNTLVKLDADRRNEELAFWKDMTDLRQQLVEKAAEYQAAHQRFRLLGDLHVSGSTYG